MLSRTHTQLKYSDSDTTQNMQQWRFNGSVYVTAHISEHPSQQPSHKIQITMGSTEARVDYMGSSILMGVFSNADLQLQDEWKVNLCTVDTSLAEKRCAMMSGVAYLAQCATWIFLQSSSICSAS